MVGCKGCLIQILGMGKSAACRSLKIELLERAIELDDEFAPAWLTDTDRTRTGHGRLVAVVVAFGRRLPQTSAGIV